MFCFQVPSNQVKKIGLPNSVEKQLRHRESTTVVKPSTSLTTQRVKKPGLLFVETQLFTDPAVTHSQYPVWKFFVGDEHNNDDSNKWALNLAGLVPSMTECQFHILAHERSGQRGFATGRASVDKRKDFYRLLDSSKHLWG